MSATNFRGKRCYLVKGALRRETYLSWAGMSAPFASSSLLPHWRGKTRRSTKNWSLFSEMQPQILINIYSPGWTMGLLPRWRSILSHEKKAPLSSGFLPIGDNAKDNEMGREPVHGISTCRDADP